MLVAKAPPSLGCKRINCCTILPSLYTLNPLADLGHFYNLKIGSRGRTASNYFAGGSIGGAGSMMGGFRDYMNGGGVFGTGRSQSSMGPAGSYGNSSSSGFGGGSMGGGGCSEFNGGHCG